MTPKEQAYFTIFIGIDVMYSKVGCEIFSLPMRRALEKIIEKRCSRDSSTVSPTLHTLLSRYISWSIIKNVSKLSKL